MHIHVGKFPTSIDDYFSFVVHFIPADRVLFDSQLFGIVFDPSRGPEHFPIDEYRGIFFIFFEPCPDRSFVNGAQKLVEIDQRDPAGRLTKLLPTVLVGRKLSLWNGPIDQVDDSSFDIWGQNFAVVVIAEVVVQEKMIDTYQQMVFDPLFKNRPLVLEDSTDRQIIELIGRILFFMSDNLSIQ